MLKKVVDGKEIVCSPDEEAAILAEWAANAARQPPTKAERLAARLDADPVLLALIDELAENRGITRAQLLARLVAKLS
jgi:hypothetical protein